MNPLTPSSFFNGQTYVTSPLSAESLLDNLKTCRLKGHFELIKLQCQLKETAIIGFLLHSSDCFDDSKGLNGWDSPALLCCGIPQWGLSSCFPDNPYMQGWILRCVLLLKQLLPRKRKPALSLKPFMMASTQRYCWVLSSSMYQFLSAIWDEDRAMFVKAQHLFNDMRQNTLSLPQLFRIWKILSCWQMALL